MSTTLVPKYNDPITVDVEEIRDELQDALEIYRGDEDKAGTIDDVSYYAGGADILESFLKWITQPTTQNKDPEMAKQETMDTIEKTIDTVDDTLDTLERIPKVNLNGTTKSQQVLILGTTAAVGIFVGVVLTNAWKKGKFHLRRRKNKKVIEEFVAAD